MFTRTSGYLAFVIILLSRVRLSECPFLYDIVGGSLKISLSNDCCCTKCHLLMKNSLMFRTVGQYCVIAKGKIHLFPVRTFTFLKFHFGEGVVNEVFQVVSFSQLCLTFPSNFSFKWISLEELLRVFFDEAFLCSLWVTRCEEFAPECLRWFEVGSHVENWLPVESFTLIDNGV